MTTLDIKNKRYTSHSFKYAKEQFSIRMSGKNNPIHQHTYTIEQKAKMSRLGFVHSAETKKLLSYQRKGKPKSEQWKKQHSLRITGSGNPMHGRHTTPWNTGKSLSKDHIQKIHKPATCVFCGKVANISNITRWHMNNCKYK